MNPIHINLNNNISVIINYSGSIAEYRYDIYDDDKIIGSLGVDSIIEDKTSLSEIIKGYLILHGGFS